MVIRTTFEYKDSKICINDRDISKNVINIDGIDYYADYIDPIHRNNKGANSFILVLYQAQKFEDKENSTPERVIKISKYKDFEQQRSGFNNRFYREIEALENCTNQNLSHIVTIHYSGQLSCVDNKGKKFIFPFYMLDYASCDLKRYLEENHIDYNDKINLCLELAIGLKDLKELGYYHRDLKPDNILFLYDTWKIGDLGLIAHRDEDNVYDKKNELIGPKGWLSPEAMNKYLSTDENADKFDCKIDHQSDIFQLGKIFWYIFQGNAPIGCVCRNDYVGKYDDMYSLIKHMLNHSKKKRPSTIDYVIDTLNRFKRKYNA